MRYHHLLQQVLTTLLRQHRKSQKVLWISQQPLRSFRLHLQISQAVLRKHLRSSMIHTGLHRSMLRKQITAIQRCRAWLMLSDASMIHLSRLRISFLRLRILPVRQTFFHSMQLSRQRVQVRQVKDSQLLRDKSEVFQSRVPRLRLTHVSL